MNLYEWLRYEKRSELELIIVSWPHLPQRFWDKVSLTENCWNWIGCRVRSYNLMYPRFTLGGFSFPAHKVMYLITHGSVPSGMEIHHECRNTICVNPSHLKMVTSRENRLLSNGVSGINSRKTHCVRGHELSGDNLIVYETPARKRVCRACQKSWQINRQEKINNEHSLQFLRGN